MTSTTSQRSGLRRVPVYLWVLAAVGAIAGALLAEPGNFWANTVPSTLTFLLVGVVLGLAVWGVTTLVRRR